MGNGTFNWDGLLIVMNFEISNELMKVELPPKKIWEADFSSVRPSSARRVNRHLTQQDGILLRETEHSRSCVTFFSSFCRKNVTQDRELPGTCFRHSAVLSFPVTLLRKLSNLRTFAPKSSYGEIFFISRLQLVDKVLSPKMKKKWGSPTLFRRKWQWKNALISINRS